MEEVADPLRLGPTVFATITFPSCLCWDFNLYFQRFERDTDP